MPSINDTILDSALAYVTTNGDRIDICSQEPTTHTEATSTYSLGNETGVTVGSATNGVVSGRRVVVPAISAVPITDDGTATHFALTKSPATAALLTAQALDNPQAVVSGGTFNLAAWNIEFRDPT